MQSPHFYNELLYLFIPEIDAYVPKHIISYCMEILLPLDPNLTNTFALAHSTSQL
jgi:hypothetical protein